MIPTGIGNDTLGAAFFIKEAIKAATVGDVFGIMPETFTGKKKGDGWKAVEALGASKKFFEGVVHITPFDNSHQYPVKKLTPLIKKNVLRMEALANKYPHQIWMISFFCEHNHPRSVMEPLYKEMKPLAPSCLFINAIWRGQEVPGMITEIHLTSSKTLPPEPKLEYVVAYDGFGGDKKHPGDFPDANHEAILKKYPRRRHTRAWGARHNGKFSPLPPKPGESAVPPPNQRKHWPSVGYLRGHRETLTPRQGTITWEKDKLLKTFADDHGAGGKDNKLMVILPKGGNSVEVIDSNGKVIDKLTTKGLPPHTGDPKGPRYYSNDYAVDVADRALKSGSRVVRVRSGKTLSKPTDVMLRSGKFK